MTTSTDSLLVGTQLATDRQAGVMPPAHSDERLVKFVFRAVIGPHTDPDDIIQHGPQLLFEDRRSVSCDPDDPDQGDYSVYVPEGSYWTNLKGES